MEEESIYNIIPRNPEISPKKPLYKSKYPHNIPPTASTFVHHTTSRPGVNPFLSRSRIYLASSTLVYRPIQKKVWSKLQGMLKDCENHLPMNLQKRELAQWVTTIYPQVKLFIIKVRNFSYDCSHKRPYVPRVTEKPILGLKSDKNFIVANAV